MAKRQFFVQIILYSLFFPAIACAASAPPGIGGVADNMLEPISILTDFVTTAALLVGSMFFFVAFIKYMQYRKNPLAVPINNVIFLVIFGIVLVVLPLSYKLTDATEPPTHVDYNKK